MLEIAQLGQPVLRETAEEVPPGLIPTEQFQDFLRQMAATLEASRGVGLAAPQVFAGVRVFLAVIVMPEPDEPRHAEVFINPRLTVLTQETAQAWEGCLSFQELLVLVPRYRSVQVDYLDAQGAPHSIVLEDFAARVVQHEYDHLDGILTIDRAASTRDIIKASEIQALLGSDQDEDVESE
jgi:peptide deformylase